MSKRLTGALLLTLLSQLALADVVEISPDLFLLTQSKTGSSESRLKMDAIRAANALATERGKVAVPISGRLVAGVGFAPAIYEYQFRIVSREEALALKPVLADVVITTHGASTEGATMYAELQRQKERKLLAAPPPAPAPPQEAVPVAAPPASGQ